MITLLFDRKSLMLVSACGLALGMFLFFGGTAVGLRIQLESTSLNALSYNGPRAGGLAPLPVEIPTETTTVVMATGFGTPPSPAQVAHASTAGDLRDWETWDFQPWDPMAGPRGEEASSPNGSSGDPPEGSSTERRPAAALPEEFLRASPAIGSPSDANPSSPQARPAVYIFEGSQSSTGAEEELDGFTVQVGAYGQMNNAAARVTALRSAGWDSVLIAEVGDPVRALFSVRIGRFHDRDDALRHAARFRSATDQDAIVRPLLGTERESL